MKIPGHKEGVQIIVMNDRATKSTNKQNTLESARTTQQASTLLEISHNDQLKDKSKAVEDDVIYEATPDSRPNMTQTKDVTPIKERMSVNFKNKLRLEELIKSGMLRGASEDLQGNLVELDGTKSTLRLQKTGEYILDDKNSGEATSKSGTMPKIIRDVYDIAKDLFDKQKDVIDLDNSSLLVLETNHGVP